MKDRLIEQLKKGNEKAFQLVFEQLWQKMYAIAYRRLEDKEQAQDVVQEVFAALWDRRERLPVQDFDHLTNYLLQALKHKILNIYTAQETTRRVLRQVLQESEESLTQVPPAYDYQEVQLFVDAEIEKLPETMRNVVKMHEQEHKPYQIAASLNLAEQTVRNYLSEAFQRLRIKIMRKFSN